MGVQILHHITPQFEGKPTPESSLVQFVRLPKFAKMEKAAYEGSSFQGQPWNWQPWNRCGSCSSTEGDSATPAS